MLGCKTSSNFPNFPGHDWRVWWQKLPFCSQLGRCSSRGRWNYSLRFRVRWSKMFSLFEGLLPKLGLFFDEFYDVIVASIQVFLSIYDLRALHKALSGTRFDLSCFLFTHSSKWAKFLTFQSSYQLLLTKNLLTESLATLTAPRKSFRKFLLK